MLVYGKDSKVLVVPKYSIHWSQIALSNHSIQGFPNKNILEKLLKTGKKIQVKIISSIFKYSI
jgi:hypothetical protein